MASLWLFFCPGYVTIRRHRMTMSPHCALTEQKIAHKSTHSGKRQQTLVNPVYEL